MRKRKVFEHNTKSLMNLRPQNYMNLRPQTKIVNPRLQKSCEPKANHAACSANASGGEALRPPPNPPPAVFFFRPTSSAGTAHPHLKRLHLQLQPQKKNNSQNKKNNSQNISAPYLKLLCQLSRNTKFLLSIFFICIIIFCHGY